MGGSERHDDDDNNSITLKPPIHHHHHKHRLSRRPSLWNRLPTEIQDKIILLSDHLTQYLNHYIHEPSEPDIDPPLSPFIATQIWRDAFTQSWEGDLAILPPSGLPDMDNGLQLVTSRKIYEQLCLLYPDDAKLNDVHDLQLDDYNSDRMVLMECLELFKTRLVNIALRNGWTDILAKITSPVAYFKYALYFNHPKYLKYVCEERELVDPLKFSGDCFPDVTHHGAQPLTLLYWAITFNNIYIVEYFLKRGYKIHDDAFDLAASNGYLEMVKLLHGDPRIHCTSFAMGWAAKNGHFEVVKFLHENRKEGCTKAAMDWAAANGYYEVS
jgi:hypothetical protein